MDQLARSLKVATWVRIPLGLQLLRLQIALDPVQATSVYEPFGRSVSVPGSRAFYSLISGTLWRLAPSPPASTCAPSPGDSVIGTRAQPCDVDSHFVPETDQEAADALDECFEGCRPHDSRIARSPRALFGLITTVVPGGLAETSTKTDRFRRVALHRVRNRLVVCEVSLHELRYFIAASRRQSEGSATRKGSSHARRRLGNHSPVTGTRRPR